MISSKLLEVAGCVTGDGEGHRHSMRDAGTCDL